jgi:hypothetical protein
VVLNVKSTIGLPCHICKVIQRTKILHRSGGELSNQLEKEIPRVAYVRSLELPWMM